MPAVINNLTPYSGVQNSFDRYMNDGPLTYNRPSQLIRPSGDSVNINPNGGRPRTREDRIQQMADKALEQFDAQQLIRQGIGDRRNTDYRATTDAARQQLQNSFLGPELNRSSYGGNANSGDAWSRYMNSVSGDALFGGTRTTPEARYQGWNNQIAQRSYQANQVLAPLYSKWGLRPPRTDVQTPWNP